VEETSSKIHFDGVIILLYAVMRKTGKGTWVGTAFLEDGSRVKIVATPTKKSNLMNLFFEVQSNPLKRIGTILLGDFGKVRFQDRVVNQIGWARIEGVDYDYFVVEDKDGKIWIV
jgi:hypothetical protein